jgi:hypothetical protein
MDEGKRWLKAEDAATYVRVQVDQSRRLVRTGRLPPPSHSLGPRFATRVKNCASQKPTVIEQFHPWDLARPPRPGLSSHLWHHTRLFRSPCRSDQSAAGVAGVLHAGHDFLLHFVPGCRLNGSQDGWDMVSVFELEAWIRS